MVPLCNLWFSNHHFWILIVHMHKSLSAWGRKDTQKRERRKTLGSNIKFGHFCPKRTNEKKKESPTAGRVNENWENNVLFLWLSCFFGGNKSSINGAHTITVPNLSRKTNKRVKPKQIWIKRLLGRLFITVCGCRSGSITSCCCVNTNNLITDFVWIRSLPLLLGYNQSDQQSITCLP